MPATEFTKINDLLLHNQKYSQILEDDTSKIVNQQIFHTELISDKSCR